MVINVTDAAIEEAIVEGAITGLTIGVIIAMVALIFILVIAFYVYHALAWSKIAKRKKHKQPWLAWIPFANSAMRLQLGKFHWAWVFLYLIPIFGWIAIFILLIISHWRIFESLKYPGWLALLQLADILGNGIGSLAYLIVIGIVAWKKPETITQIKKKATKKKVVKKKVSKKKVVKKKVKKK
jgi:heme/copper-type cytochrome/quinol oxidase subunit 2